MITRPVRIASNDNSILFDDRALLEKTVGKDAIKVSSVNTNCDCASYPLTARYDDRNSDQVAPFAG